jgi:hypothetical protein
MAGTKEILQEYLVMLGFSTDAISLKKFQDGLSDTGKKILSVGAGVAATVTAVEAATAAFAYSMRKMYFQSELANTTASNMEAVAYASKQIGISGEQMQSTIESLGMAIRSNPGLEAWASALTGIQEHGRDATAVMGDLIRVTNKMPVWQQSQILQNFGIDPATAFLLREHYGEFIRYKQEFLRLQKESGVDPQKAKGTILHYTHELDQLEARIKLLGESLLIALTKPFDQATTYLNNLIQKWTDFANGLNSGKTNKEFTEATKDKNYIGKILMGIDIVREAIGMGITANDSNDYLHKLGTNTSITSGVTTATLGVAGKGTKTLVNNNVTNNIEIHGKVDEDRLAKNIARDTVDAWRQTARYTEGVPR